MPPWLSLKGAYFLFIHVTDRMKRLLVCLLLAITLTGCDVFESEDSGPDWIGDWELIESFDGEAPVREVYFTYSKDRLTTFVNAGSGCNIFTREIVEVDGNDVRIEIGSNGLETQRLTVSDGNLDIKIIRSNNPGVEDETLKATSVEDSPRELLGCQTSASDKGKVPSFRGNQ